jgi:hypothetical protein
MIFNKVDLSGDWAFRYFMGLKVFRGQNICQAVAFSSIIVSYTI